MAGIETFRLLDLASFRFAKQYMSTTHVVQTEIQVTPTRAASNETNINFLASIQQTSK